MMLIKFLNTKIIYIFILLIITVIFSLTAIAENSTEKTFLNGIENCWQEKITPDATGIIISSNFPDSRWWEKFNDQLLNSYLQQTIISNHNLLIAQSRIEQYTQKTNIIRSAEYPQITLRDLFARISGSENFLVPKVGQSSLPVQSFLGGGTQNLFSLPLTAQYEVDYLRKNHLKTLSAMKLSEISIFEYNIAKIATLSDFAAGYFNLVKYDKLLCLNLKLLNILEQLKEHRQSKYEAGEISLDKVLQTNEDISLVKMRIEDIKKYQGQISHFLTVLNGKIPVKESCFNRNNIDQLDFLGELPLGNPLELINRRPDIQVSEKMLEKAGIDIAIAKREFFPDLTVLGLFSYASSNLDNFFSWGSNSKAIATILSQSLYTGGKLRASVNLNKANYKEALQNYHRTILTALRETEDSIGAINSTRTRYKLSQNNILLSNERLSLTKDKYNEGYSSYLDVLENEKDLVGYEIDMTGIKTELLTNYISLYKALGGGY
jgi:NodT family efflux transporter outer membrane factor (OMF) lipoprotein